MGLPWLRYWVQVLWFWDCFKLNAPVAILFPNFPYLHIFHPFRICLYNGDARFGAVLVRIFYVLLALIRMSQNLQPSKEQKLLPLMKIVYTCLYVV